MVPLTHHLQEYRVSARVLPRFRGSLAWASNFYWLAPPIRVNDVVFPTTEHAFQALKSLDPEDWARMAEVEGAARAKSRGHDLLLRPDWEEVCDLVMFAVNIEKFRNLARGALLRATYPCILVEGNDHHDARWGACQDPRDPTLYLGENRLGQVHMQIRDLLLSGTYPRDPIEIPRSPR